MIVCCNGNGDAKDKYLTVFVSTLKGLYDTSLAWPLNYTITFRIATAGELLKLRVNSQRILDDCGFSSYARGITLVNDIQSLELGLLNLPDGCLCIQVCGVAF
jgi:hypothetical protein